MKYEKVIANLYYGTCRYDCGPVPTEMLTRLDAFALPDSELVETTLRILWSKATSHWESMRQDVTVQRSELEVYAFGNGWSVRWCKPGYGAWVASLIAQARRASAQTENTRTSQEDGRTSGG